MTVEDFLKRIDPEKDKYKMLIFEDDEGWSNIKISKDEHQIVIRADCSSPFSDDV